MCRKIFAHYRIFDLDQGSNGINANKISKSGKTGDPNDRLNIVGFDPCSVNGTVGYIKQIAAGTDITLYDSRQSIYVDVLFSQCFAQTDNDKAYRAGWIDR